MRIFWVIGAVMMALPGASVWAETKPAPVTKRVPDLADALAGTYQGDVISDARGSSKSGVTVTVTRIGKNRIEVRSDYARLPTVTIPVMKAMNAIIAESGPYVVFLNRAADPTRLDLTIDDASWSGRKQPDPPAS